ncbi:hypothetical protein D3C85_1467980 [compost metagenome]
MQLDRQVAADQRLKAAADLHQYLLQRHAFRQLEDQFGQLRRAGGDHRRGEQRFLVGEVAVDREF